MRAPSFSALLCFLLTSMDSIISILKASGFQLGSASIVRGVQRMEERQVVIVLSPVSLLQEHGSGSSRVPLWPLLLSGGPPSIAPAPFALMLTPGCLPRCH